VSGLGERFLTFGLIATVTAVLLATAGVVITLAFYCLALMFLFIYNQRQLTLLDEWLQAGEPSSAELPDSSGKWELVFSRLTRLMREQRKSHESVKTALERLQRATSAMPEGVIIMDETDRIEWCNPVAESHFGIEAKIDAGQPIDHLVRSNQFTSYLAARNYSEPLVIKLSRQQGEILSLQLVPYGNRQKLLISRDVTRIERVQTMRRDFVANVSHELRTPLTVIGGFLETLSEENGEDPEMRKWVVSLMSDQAGRMQRLVEDLLTLSRLEDTENLVREDLVDMPEMLRELYCEAQSLSGERHHISLNLATDARLLGSLDELRSAFSNLVSNAIRYTGDGGTILLDWTIVDGQGVFSVRDTGIGIDKQHIPRLTERFYRVDRGRSRETGGTGLGLAIVKHALTCHHATLHISSEPGKGSCFSARFPARRLVPSATALQ
jgi:two-component system, OmpR family, phosphate regulon sensor histidine kinase PhoR